MMSALAPLGPVYQAGTLSGNPLATAAGTTVLNLVTPRDYQDLTQRVATFAQNLEAAIATSGLYARCPTQGPLMGLFLSREPFEAPTNFDEAKLLCENGLYRSFFHAMLERGVALAPVPTRYSSSRSRTAATTSPMPSSARAKPRRSPRNHECATTQ